MHAVMQTTVDTCLQRRSKICISNF